MRVPESRNSNYRVVMQKLRSGVVSYITLSLISLEVFFYAIQRFYSFTSVAQ